MENTNNKKVWAWVIAIVIIILIAIGFYASYKANQSGNQPTDTGSQTSDNTQTQPQAQTINVKHQYKNGTHTYAGVLDVPSPCYTISNKVVTDPATPNKVTIAFTSANTASTGTVCAQVITSRSFKVSFPGVKNASVNATLDGNPLILNVFEVGANDNIDTVDIYTKG